MKKSFKGMFIILFILGLFSVFLLLSSVDNNVELPNSEEQDGESQGQGDSTQNDSGSQQDQGLGQDDNQNKLIDLEINTEDLIQEYNLDKVKEIPFNFDESLLLPGHRIEQKFDDIMIDVGSYNINVNYNILNENNENVTNLYNISGKLNSIVDITPCNVVVNLPKTITHTYNGGYAVINKTDFTHDCILPVNINAFIVDDVKEVGEHRVKVRYEVIDRKGIDLTNNFNIDSTNDLLVNIVPRPINIEFNELIKEYDGKPFDINKYVKNVPNLLENHIIKLSSKEQYIKPGKYPFDFDFVIMDEYNKNIASNYTYNSNEFHQLEITPRYISFDPIRLQTEYNGVGFDLLKQLTITKGSLLDGDILSINGYNDGFIKDVGIYDNIDVVVKDQFGNISNDYYVQPLSSFIEITPINLDYYLLTNKLPYTGFEYDLNQFIKTQGNIINGHKVELDIFTNVKLIDAGNYSVPVSLRILDSNYNDETKNYKFNLKTFGIEITPRDILVDINFKNYIYNDNIFDEINTFINDNIKSINSNLEFDLFKFKDNFRGAKSYLLDSSYINYLGSDPHNYNIKFNEVLTIEKGNVSLTINGTNSKGEIIHIYNGSSYKLPIDNIVLIENNAPLKNVVINNIITNTISKVNIPTKLEILSYSISVNGVNIDSLYNIKKPDVMVNILPRPITFKCEPITVTNKNLVNKQIIQKALEVSTATPLVGGDFIYDFSFECNDTFTKVYIKNIIIHNTAGEDVTSSYNNLDTVIEGDIYEVFN